MMRVEVCEAIPKNLDDFAKHLEQTGAYDEQEISRIRRTCGPMYSLLQINEVKVPPDDLVALDEMHSLAARQAASSLSLLRPSRRTSMQIRTNNSGIRTL